MRFIQNGLFTIMLFSTLFLFSCGDDDETLVKVETDFTVTNRTIVQGEELTFTDVTTGDPTSWKWSFVGGSPRTSNLQNPVVMYSTPGTYRVSLTTSNGNEPDTEEKTEFITVTEKLQAKFLADFQFGEAAIPGERVRFISTSTGETDNLKWTFENGTPSTSTEISPTVTYATTGTFNVTLEVNDGSNSSTELKEEFIRVIDPVNVQFDANNTTIIEGEIVTFSNNSSGNPGSFFWRFEGGSPSVSRSRNPQVFYPTAGTYDVSLSATNDADNDFDAERDFITVLPRLVAAFDVSTTLINVGDEVEFTDRSSGNPDSWQWTFEGGSPATSTNADPQVTYNSPGVFKVSLEVTTDEQDSDIIFEEYIAVRTNSGLVASYDLDGDAVNGSDIGDIDGVLVNEPVAAPDRNGIEDSALEFDLFDNQHVELSTKLDNLFATGVTFSAWIYPTRSNRNMIIASNFNATGQQNSDCSSTDGRVGFTFAIESDNALRFTYHVGDNDFIGKRTNFTLPETNVWYHVAGTWDGTLDPNGFKLYINGVERATSDRSRGTVCTEYKESNSLLRIGTSLCSFGGFCGSFDGRIDDVQIYDSDLTKNEIQNLAGL
ncbi:PKD domain-containing protein [Fulvivirga sp. M361]|uniref:LamG domain-containing protein n=1 Tax=Fulvivirga sp. M361 TaxID=2594266 RepID=UPI00117BBD19|nr:PKD domain-containing protein [Fulvivirga sp. M361]TRX53074.1 PKD domain-containing protein [Fulvivirga sp. M361]